MYVLVCKRKVNIAQGIIYRRNQSKMKRKKKKKVIKWQETGPNITILSFQPCSPKAFLSMGNLFFLPSVVVLRPVSLRSPRSGLVTLGLLGPAPSEVFGRPCCALTIWLLPPRLCCSGQGEFSFKLVSLLGVWRLCSLGLLGLACAGICWLGDVTLIDVGVEVAALAV